MAIPRCLFLLLTIAILGGCSKMAAPEASKNAEEKSASQPVVPAGSLLDPGIRYEFAIYYAPTPSTDPLTGLTGLLEGEFSHVKRVETLPENPAEMVVTVKQITNVAESYAPPDLEALSHFGRGLSKEQADALQGSMQVLVLDFSYSQEKAWDHLRTACQLTSQLARQTDGFLWDEETREVFTPDAWDNKRLKDWKAGVPDISRHIVIHAYSTGEFVRAISLGMVKFGLPDIVVENFSWSSNKHIGHIINLFSQTIAENSAITTAGEYDLDLKALEHEEVRESQIDSLKGHATAKAQLSLRKVVRDEGDPANRLIALGFDRYPGNDEHARQDAMVSALFGWSDAIKKVKHDDKSLQEASERARAKLPALRAEFVKRLPPSHYILLKAPFKTVEDGNEWMWVEVTNWDGEKIKGLLKNEPFKIPSLHAGQIVEIEQGAVFDYIRRFADGTQEGNETGEILTKMPGSEEKR